MTEIQVSGYSTRADLEADIQKIPETERADHEIVGTVEELAVLHLSRATLVYGVGCRATDPENDTAVAGHEPVARGQVSDFGLNGVTTKLPSDGPPPTD